MFNPLLWQFCKLFPYLECLHEISNKEIFFPDKYRMLFSSGDTAGRKVNSILGQKIMLQLENCLLWMSGNSWKGGVAESGYLNFSTLCRRLLSCIPLAFPHSSHHSILGISACSIKLLTTSYLSVSSPFLLSSVVVSTQSEVCAFYHLLCKGTLRLRRSLRLEGGIRSI